MSSSTPDDQAAAVTSQSNRADVMANLAGRPSPDELIEQALATFDREFPQLVVERKGQWVAYHGTRRVGFGNTRGEAWHECLRQGLPEGEFWVFNIQPIIGHEIMGLGGCKVEYTE